MKKDKNQLDLLLEYYDIKTDANLEEGIWYKNEKGELVKFEVLEDLENLILPEFFLLDETFSETFSFKNLKRSEFNKKEDYNIDYSSLSLFPNKITYQKNDKSEYTKVA